MADLLAAIDAGTGFGGRASGDVAARVEERRRGRACRAFGRTREAIAHFEQALRIEPASRRASAEADRCRDALAAQRAIDERAAAMLEEARKAAAAKQWQAAITLCDDALVSIRASRKPRR